MPDRQAFEEIVHVLRTEIQWNALLHDLGASTSVLSRFLEWERKEFFLF